MSLNIETKKVAVEEISAAIANAQTLVVAEYRGISVSSMTELRANARKEGVYLRVLKNTLGSSRSRGYFIRRFGRSNGWSIGLRCF